MVKFSAKLLFAGVLCCTVAFAATDVVPNGYGSLLGGDNSGTLPTTAFSGEFQQVFASGEFPAAGPINITGFNFRALPGTGAVQVTVSGNVFVSYSNNPPQSISATFANNVGAGNTLVLTASGLVINDPGCAAGPTPCPFGSGDFVFTTPFSYNRSNGPLLVDLKFTSFVSTGTGEWDVADCTISICASNGVTAMPLGSTTGFVQDSNNVVQFTYTAAPSATPVPSSILLMLLGLACVGFYVGRRGIKLA
jgi:hypothetical protein